MFELLCMLFASAMFGMNISIPVLSHVADYRHYRRQQRERANRTNSRENLI